MLMKCIRPAHGGKAPNQVSEAAGRGPAEGRQRTRTHLSAPLVALSGHPPGSGSRLVLEPTVRKAAAEKAATCTHRDGGQRVSVSGRHGVLTARQAQGHVQALIRRARTCLALLIV